MARSKKVSKADAANDARSLSLAQRGVQTASDFANLMSAMMSDVVEGKIAPGVANAACNAGGKLLKVVDMAHRYGTRDGKSKTLVLADGGAPSLKAVGE